MHDLIEASADLYAADATGATALDLARKKQHAKAVALLEAATAKQPRKADPSADLIFAAEKGNTELVKQLLTAGAHPDTRDRRPKSKGFTPLMLAARAGHRETAVALLDGGADLALKDDAEPGNDSGFNFIFKEGGIEHILECGYSMFRTALHWAAEKGNADVVQLLIERGADVNSADRAKLTPLHLATEARADEIVADLLRADACPDARARGKQSPLHHACRAGNVGIVRRLLAAGVKVELKNDDGNTPLIIAAGHAHPAVVVVLLEAGADVHATNREGETAIHLATGPRLYEHKYQKGKGLSAVFIHPEAEILETVRLLIAAGADPSAKNKFGISALDWAARGLKDSGFFSSVIELLQKARPRKTTPPAAWRSAKPLPGFATPKPKPASASNEPAPRPDFSEAAQRAEFQAALKELEKLCGTKL